jgi:hypothetical protein
MRSLTYPLEDELSIFDTVSGARSALDQAALVTLRPTISGAYGKYGSAASVVSLAPVGLTLIEGDLVAANYDVLRTGRCREIGARIMARSSKCCLCGDRQTGQLDHHLPKGAFPEFAALSANLIPACGTCNQKKSSTYLRAGGGAAYLHAYRDALPEAEQFLVAEIEIQGTVIVTFSLVQTPGISSELFEILTHHFTALGLADHYGERATELLVERRISFHDYYGDDGPESLARYLEREARSARRAYGANHWKPVALDALANDESFCNGGFKVLGGEAEL